MKHCVITGSNRGIGLELVKSYLARDGWHIHACCRSPEKAENLRSLVTENLGRMTLHALEVTDAASVQQLSARLGNIPIDLLINNAGIMGGDKQTLSNMDFDAWADTLAVNSIAPMRVAQALLPNLRAAKGAKLVTISSQMGSLARKSTGFYAYRSSKAAVNKVMQVMAEEVRADSITCIVMHPGWVKTDMGGDAADITVEESASGIAKVIDALTIEETGSFLTWEGEQHPW